MNTILSIGIVGFAGFLSVAVACFFWLGSVKRFAVHGASGATSEVLKAAIN